MLGFVLVTLGDVGVGPQHVQLNKDFYTIREGVKLAKAVGNATGVGQPMWATRQGQKDGQIDKDEGMDRWTDIAGGMDEQTNRQRQRNEQLNRWRRTE